MISVPALRAPAASCEVPDGSRRHGRNCAAVLPCVYSGPRSPAACIGWLRRLSHSIRPQRAFPFERYRALILKDGKRVQIRSRNDKDLTRTYSAIAGAALHLHADRVVVDGEIVALAEDGRPSFQALQHSSSKRLIVFYTFDVLQVRGRDLMGEPLEDRRAHLAELF
jgi:hypothetical protein